MQAASELAKDPSARVRCPDGGQSLSTPDEQVHALHMDRRIFCTSCGREEGAFINTLLRNIQ